MTPVESVFLSSLECSLKGIPVQKDPELTPDQWQQVFSLATRHHVLPLVFEAVHNQSSLRDTAILPGVRMQVRQQVFLQTRKTADFLKLLEALQSAGVQPLVVKGIHCRSLYPKPDHRYSSDEDLLIRPDQLALCREIFGRFGLATDKTADNWSQVHEIPFRQKNGPLYIELHQSLFPKESGAYGHLNRFFEDVFSRSTQITVNGVRVPGPGPTDHLFYLICHALKHFLHSGFGIRQVCDILMFARAYTQDIDWPLLLKNCRRIRALYFTASIFRIGFTCLGFDPADFPAALTGITVDEGPMLQDLLQAGIYGSASESRLHSSSITLEAAASGREKRTARNPVLLSLFPSAHSLEGRYAYLKDRPWLLPAAWASRVGSYCRDSLMARPASAGESLKLGAQRTKLLRFYGILADK